MTEPLGLIAGFLLFFALFVYTFWPQRHLASQREQTRLDDLLERKEQLSEDLRDLSFEFHAGKYSEEDYQTQRAQLESETARLLVEVEHLQQA
jgi:predicted nuclease with TOPRIM domain